MQHLGPLRTTLGDIKIYTPTIQDLLKIENIKPWDEQRSLNEMHVMEIANSYLHSKETYNKVNILGAIILCYLNDEFLIIDGQHRYYAFKKLNDIQRPINNRIIIQVIECTNQTDVQRHFADINKAMPLLNSQLKPEEIINLVASKLRDNFPGSFNRSKKPVRPIMNYDEFKQKLLIGGIIRQIAFKIRTPTELYDKLIEYNDNLRDNNNEEWFFEKATANGHVKRSIRVAYEKCDNGNLLYLGVLANYEWITDFVEFLHST